MKKPFFIVLVFTSLAAPVQADNNGYPAPPGIYSQKTSASPYTIIEPVNRIKPDSKTIIQHTLSPQINPSGLKFRPWDSGNETLAAIPEKPSSPQTPSVFVPEKAVYNKDPEVFPTAKPTNRYLPQTGFTSPPTPAFSRPRPLQNYNMNSSNTPFNFNPGNIMNQFFGGLDSEWAPANSRHLKFGDEFPVPQNLYGNTASSYSRQPQKFQVPHDDIIYPDSWPGKQPGSRKRN